MLHHALWAKKSRAGEMTYLPLEAHLRDAAEVAERLWEKWLSPGLRAALAKACGCDEEEVKRLFVFLSAVHDVGKITPAFQHDSNGLFPELDARIRDALWAAGFALDRTLEKTLDKRSVPHAKVGAELLLERGFTPHIAMIIGAHHGKPPDYNPQLFSSHGEHCGADNKHWRDAQRQAIDFALERAGYQSAEDLPRPSQAAQVLLCGLLIMADWIASNAEYFPLVPLDLPMEAYKANRGRDGWRALDLPPIWDAQTFRLRDFEARFGIPTPFGIQRAMIDLHCKQPGIVVLEAPMGSGKTEAALALAETFARKTGRSGVFFALPTQATSNGIFDRVEQWIEKMALPDGHSIQLAHGKAQFNDNFTKLRRFAGASDLSEDDEAEDKRNLPFVHSWFNGNKRTMLAEFVAGTIDQLLLMALKQKHLMLRHLGLASKVVIIDECHAYDAYMSEYLLRALRWLGAYGTPVIVLSATLTAAMRGKVIGAYLRGKALDDSIGSNAYPLITYTDGEAVQTLPVEWDGPKHPVKIDYLDTEQVADKLAELLAGGGCAGIILNTVTRAQEMAKKLRERFGEEKVELLHSRFLAPEREEKEKALRKDLGRNGARRMRIVVGTQVLEQSLDIDFDLLFTDIAPMDLLLQRLGRQFRHKRERPALLKEALCFVLGCEGEDFAQGLKAVYAEYLLRRTKGLLAAGCTVALPGDIAGLVARAYEERAEDAGWVGWSEGITEKKRKANDFRLSPPSKHCDASLARWLQNAEKDDPSGARGAAAVRDGQQGLEVIVVKQTRKGFALLDGKPLPQATPDDKLAKEIARNRLTLPIALSKPTALAELEKIADENMRSWNLSAWLHGELFLILDEENMAELCGYRVAYSALDGLSIEKI
ncbi:MAG: CRISPR-associated helicase Cas3' [Oscillospiraceae bacterium]|jgi:CRISPR-associated endonuclease/helicase Cas3|nr:CRISPR-associated helicase Cas3' [Oscillospiraceae bacterium]